MPERWQQELRKLTSLEPPAGLWDQVMRGPRREPRRAHRTWQVIAPIAAALAVAVVVGTLALVRSFGPSAIRPGSSAQRQAGRFVDPQFGWTIGVPKGLQVGHFHSTGMSGSDGVRVTNFPPNLRAPSTGTPPMGWLRSFPADGVAVQIWIGERFPVGVPPLRDSALPLSPASFQRIRPYVGGNEPAPRYRVIYGDGFSFAAAVWLGLHASRAEQHAAWAVVRSLRFPALREGTIWRGTYYVLGRASRYPAGSVTTFPASSLPGGHRRYLEGFYLIRARGAFYVITNVFQTQPPPSFKLFTCTVVLDPNRSRFSCPGTNLRWNRAGHPVGARARSGPYWDRTRYAATVAQDGHVLVRPFYR